MGTKELMPPPNLLRAELTPPSGRTLLAVRPRAVDGGIKEDEEEEEEEEEEEVAWGVVGAEALLASTEKEEEGVDPSLWPEETGSAPSSTAVSRLLASKDPTETESSIRVRFPLERWDDGDAETGGEKEEEEEGKEEPEEDGAAPPRMALLSRCAAYSAVGATLSEATRRSLRTTHSDAMPSEAQREHGVPWSHERLAAAHGPQLRCLCFFTTQGSVACTMQEAPAGAASESMLLLFCRGDSVCVTNLRGPPPQGNPRGR
jgi:hypothetical protein